jgi:hypothetical protein
MRTQTDSTRSGGGAQVASEPQSTPRAEAGSPPYRQIKLALDVRAADLMVVSMVDGAKLQPPQKMTQSRLLEWVRKQKSQAQEVISCYLPAGSGAKPVRPASGCTDN